MNYKKRAQKLKDDCKDYFIPNLRVVHDGKEYPVVTTIQAHCEWSEEYGRAEFLRKVSITELLVIVIFVFWEIIRK